MLRCIYMLLCLQYRMAHGMVDTADNEDHSDMSRFDEAAPVPNPEAETLGQYRHLAEDPGRGRSEGWESCPAPENGVSVEQIASIHPVKSGSQGRIGTTTSRIRKRAYKRALHRAQQGSTMYRGREYTLHQLQGQYVSQASQRQRVAEGAAAQTGGKSRLATITCFSWNCGGLSTVRDELFTWLEDQTYDVVFLQETWYRDPAEYTTRGWHCICSGTGIETKRAQAGVTTLLRASVFNQEYIRHHEHVAGRFLQVKAWCRVAGWIQ